MLNIKKLSAVGLMALVVTVASTQTSRADSEYDQWAIDASWDTYVATSEFANASGYHYYAYEYALYGYVFAYYADLYDSQEYWYYAAVFNYYSYFNAFLAAEEDLSSGYWLTTPPSVTARDLAYNSYVANVYAYHFFQ